MGSWVMTPANMPVTLIYSEGKINSWKQTSLFWGEKLIEQALEGL